MPTRFYLPVSGTPAGLYNGSANWTNPGYLNNVSRLAPLTTVKTDTALTDRLLAETVAVANNQAQFMWLSNELPAQTISGNVTAVVRVFESVAAADMSLQLIIRVMSSDVATVRATPYAGHAAALNTTAGALGQEYATTAATRIIPSTALTSYTCIAGDRLSIELGYRAHNTVTTSYSGTMRLGDPSATADFALTAALTTDLCPWVEFSANLALDYRPRRMGGRR